VCLEWCGNCFRGPIIIDHKARRMQFIEACGVPQRTLRSILLQEPESGSLWCVITVTGRTGSVPHFQG